MTTRRRRTTSRKPKEVDTIRHAEATRTNLPSAEHQPIVEDDVKTPIQVAYERRNRDLDPQLVWRGKDEQDESDLLVSGAAAVHTRTRASEGVDRRPDAAIAGDIGMLWQRACKRALQTSSPTSTDCPARMTKTEFYQHDANWSNRMILGDSLQVMSSLAEREGLRGKVQCIYIDPPYGIRFNSNFQWSTTSRDVRDGNRAHITREPEQVKAYRDAWRDGIHSYLSYLRDRITVARGLAICEWKHFRTNWGPKRTQRTRNDG